MRQLHETQKRLLELTGGDSDAGSVPGMQSEPPREAQEKPRRSGGARHDLAAMQSAILNAIPEHVAVLDRKGVILSVNAGWQRFAAGNAPDPSSSGLGQNYVELCETSTTGMAISTPQGRYLQVNAAYCKMLGYTAEELVQRDFASLTHPDDLTLNLKLRDELLAGQRESFVLEKRYLKKNGDIVWTRHSVSAAHGADGQIVTLMAVAEDITERKKAVSERMSADEALDMQFDLTERRRGEEALRRSGEELRALARRIESIREEQVVRIARELHDDLGQALTMLKILVLSQQRQLEQYTGEPATAQSREALELIHEALRSVRELCAELRPPVLDHLGVGPAIEILAAQFAKRAGIPCAVSGAAGLPAMDMQSQLAAYRIVQELLTNAARHAQASEVHIALRVEGGTLEIEVADNGRGIRAAETAGIRSLGLLGIRERALAAGGSITIEGRATGGTAGTMRIPILQQRETP